MPLSRRSEGRIAGLSRSAGQLGEHRLHDLRATVLLQEVGGALDPDLLAGAWASAAVKTSPDFG